MSNLPVPLLLGRNWPGHIPGEKERKGKTKPKVKTARPAWLAQTAEDEADAEAEDSDVREDHPSRTQTSRRRRYHAPATSARRPYTATPVAGPWDTPEHGTPPTDWVFRSPLPSHAYRK
ncbi:uncharacterized protein Hap1MRO34_013738 [Clarias gariepinus]